MGATPEELLAKWMKPGRVYRRMELTSLSPKLSRDLGNLLREKVLVHAARGLYYRPEKTKVGPLPASPKELVRAFLNDDEFLLTSLDAYNSLGLGLTQLYNETIVYNRKRHGQFVLDGRRFSFRRPRNFPETLSREFLFVDVLNNRSELLEDTSQLEQRLAARVKELDLDKLLFCARHYGKVSTKKFFAQMDTSRAKRKPGARR